MPGGLPQGLEYANALDYGSDLVNTHGTVCAAASANTKGTWVQLTPATTSDACWVMANVSTVDNSPWATAVDIGVGAAGSEKIILPNLICPVSQYPRHYSFPISIQAGTRIAARCQSDTGAFNSYVTVTTFDGALAQMEGCAGADALGFTAGSTTGTKVTASASANVKGAYAQLIAATARDYIGLVIGLDWFQSGAFNQFFMLDIATGPAGSEKVILSNVLCMTNEAASVYALSFPHFPFFVPIPAGSRVSARIQATGAGSTFVGCTVYGIY
jgi:hypothetical protein